MTTLAVTSINSLLCHASACSRIGSKFRCIRSTPTEMQSMSENDFECFASQTPKSDQDRGRNKTTIRLLAKNRFLSPKFSIVCHRRELGGAMRSRGADTTERQNSISLGTLGATLGWIAAWA